MVRDSLLSSAFTLHCAILIFVISLTLPVQLFLLRPLPLFSSTLPSNINFCCTNFCQKHLSFKFYPRSCHLFLSISAPFYGLKPFSSLSSSKPITLSVSVSVSTSVSLPLYHYPVSTSVYPSLYLSLSLLSPPSSH